MSGPVCKSPDKAVTQPLLWQEFKVTMQHECAEIILKFLTGGNCEGCGLHARLNPFEPRRSHP